MVQRRPPVRLESQLRAGPGSAFACGELVDPQPGQPILGRGAGDRRACGDGWTEPAFNSGVRPGGEDQDRSRTRDARNGRTRVAPGAGMLGAAASPRCAPRGDNIAYRGMSKVEGLAEIVLWVADMEAALQFYRDRFGLEIMSPPELPNKFLMVAKPGGIPEMIVLIPHPHGPDYFARHKEKRALHHLAFRVDRRSYDELENGFIEARFEVRHRVHPVLKGVRRFS